MQLQLSKLTKMWIIDIDGTIFIHNGHLSGQDKLVPNFLTFYKSIPENDYIQLITSREEKYKEKTILALKRYGIRYNNILFDAPKGERILINDTKPKGLKTAIALCTKRDLFEAIKIAYTDK